MDSAPHSAGDNYWQRNLAICVFGSFATIFAMTLVLPFLPIYVEQLGVEGHAAVAQWSGIAYGANFLSAGLIAPLWGRLGDRFGYKPMLLRASLGMALLMPLMGLATDIWQFAGLRLLAGIAGGYASGAVILVAAQTPKARSGWALGLLASGVMAGNLLGPLIGGSLPPLIGLRPIFWAAGGLIFVAFVATLFFVREMPKTRPPLTEDQTSGWSQIPNKGIIMTMMWTGLLLMVANLSIEPIITVYVRSLVQNVGSGSVFGENTAHVTFLAGLVVSAAALGSILSASWLGKVADRLGHAKVITMALAMAGLLVIPQAFVTHGWQLIGLRFLMGLALGGLLPCVAAVIRHNVPQNLVGTVLGYSLSSQFAGQVLGPLMGGFVAGHIGTRAVFFGTAALLFLGAACNFKVLRASRHA
ncbi:MFS transporter [Sinorhizobium fredii]|uniref:Multidrug resistance protein MdtG n=1 Tax=Rhizobium fredii TaxID=380 RepID=A0A2L0HAA5_RHIFR|nr:MFS transporter [Sinorhizobium fredii]AUX78357.1 multidrug resistance protein MdtG [Sinorhizobium fredii]